MSTYAEQHPLGKQAAVTPAGLGTALSRYITPMYMRNAIRSRMPEIMAGAFGLAGGAYFGNMAHQNAVPPVRALPRLHHQPLVEPYYQHPFSAGKA